jgi:hypothetical protein
MNTRPGNIDKRCGGKTATPFCCFLFLLLFMKMAALPVFPGPGDSLKITYGISDPRNPDCSCHHYQLRAEREFSGIPESPEPKAHVGSKTLKRKKYLKESAYRRKTKFNRSRRRARNFMFFKKDIAACT